MFSIELKDGILSRYRYHVFIIRLPLHDMWIGTSRLEMLNCCKEELWSTQFLPIAGVCCQTDALLIELARKHLMCYQASDDFRANIFF